MINIQNNNFLNRIVIVSLFLLCVFSPFVSQSTTTDEHFSRGNYFFVQKKYSKAISEYEFFLNQNPKNSDRGLAQYLIGSSYEAMGFIEKSREAYLKIEIIDSDSPWIDDGLLRCAKTYTHKQNKLHYERAIELFQRIINRFPDGNCNLQARFNAGKVFFKLGRWKDAEKNLQVILKLNPPDRLAVQVLLALGDFYRTMDNPLFNPQQAIISYNTIIKQFPKDASYPSTYLAIGNTYYAIGRKKIAINYYRKVIDVYSHSPQASLAETMIGLCHENDRDISHSLNKYKEIRSRKYNAPLLIKEAVNSRARKIQRLQKDAMHLQADIIDYDSSKGKAFYKGNVKIFWSDCSISCNKAIAFLKKTLISAEGSILFKSRTDLMISSQFMHFFPKKKEAVFYGDAKISMIEQSTNKPKIIDKGKKIKYNFENDSYEIE